MAALVAPPIDLVRRVTPYPSAKVTNDHVRLTELIGSNKPAVLHLYTGWGGCWPCAEQMDRWALRYGGSVSFVCICCDGQSLAETFGKNMKLAHCFNTVAASNPKWGQLGCNGFIVLDQRHSVVCKATSAYMQVREKAFKHVETLIDTLLGGGGGAPTRAPLGAGPLPGQLVRLHGLVSRADLNGAQAVVLEAAGEGGRVAVQLQDGKALKVKLTNFGQLVRLHGLVSRADLNGAQAVMLEAAGEGGRVTVQLQDGTALKVKPTNFALLTRGGGCDGGGCDGGGCDGGGECGDDRRAAMAEEDMADICDGGSWHKPSKRPLEPARAPAATRPSEAAAEMPERMRRALEKQRTQTDGAPVVVAPVSSPQSVLVADLDDEHDRCVAALTALTSRRDDAALQTLIDEYTGHFAHEEALLDEHLYAAVVSGGPSVGFSADASARASHRQDHVRLLSELRHLLDDHSSASRAPDGTLLPAHIDPILRGFERHADTYDTNYAERLAASLAAVAAA